jgi:ketosteroid isomerase-like protein
MSSENLTIINGLYEAFENRDMATFFGLLSPKNNVIQCPEVPLGGTFHDFKGAEVFFERVNAHLDSHVTIERILNGIDRIAVIGRTYGIVKGTGNPFDVLIMHLWTFKDGLAVRLEIVLDVPIMQASPSEVAEVLRETAPVA